MPVTEPTLLNQQLDALLYEEPNLVANLANAAALLMDSYDDVNWAGFYLYNPAKDELDLGPFQGKVACMHIKNGTGVVGTAFKAQASQIVPDVHQFAGHIACDAASNSELVVPLTRNGQPFGVIDIDSASLDRFKAENQAEIEQFAQILSQHIA